jgi:hypothetical protein
VPILTRGAEDVAFQDWYGLLESSVEVDVVGTFSESNEKGVDCEGEDVKLRSTSERLPQLLDGAEEGVLLVGDDDVGEGQSNEVANVLIPRAKQLRERHEESGLLNVLRLSGDVLNDGVDTFRDRDPDLGVRVVPLFKVGKKVGNESIRGDRELVSLGFEVEVETFEYGNESSYAWFLSVAAGPCELEVVMGEFRVGGPSEVLCESTETLNRFVDEIGILLLVRTDDEVIEEGEEEVGDDLAREVTCLDLVGETSKGTSTSVVLNVEDVVEPIRFDVAFDEEGFHLVEFCNSFDLFDRVTDDGENLGPDELDFRTKAVAKTRKVDLRQRRP